MIVALLFALADFGHPITFSTNCQDGRTIAVQVAVNGCQLTPLKSEFREWIDPRIVFLVESTHDTPDVLILSLYDAKLRQISIRFPRAGEVEEHSEDGP